MADGKVIIDTSLNNKGFVKGLNLMKSQADGLTGAVKKLGTVLASVFAVRAIVNFSKECIELGSNVQEVQNVVNAAFGDMAYKVEEFASGAIHNFGMSSLAAKKTASTYMAMAKNMGIAEAVASDMAITLAGLTGDVASFYNISQELADIKLKSVFTGETETLKDLGVVMTQANLAAYALENGVTRSLDSMSQAELVCLRYSFVLDQLALAQGDFARTSGSWANQTRILSMQWQEFMGIMGQALITILTPVVKTLNAIVSALINAANAFNSFVSSIFGGANTQIQQTQANAAAVGGAIEESVDQQNDLTNATKETAKAQKKMLAGFDEINKLSNNSSAGGVGGSGVGALAISPVETVQAEAKTGAAQKILGFIEGLNEALEPTKRALEGLFDELKRAGSFAWDALKDFYRSFLKPVSSWVMGEGLPRFIDAISNGLAMVDWQRINDALHKLWEALAPFAITVGEGLLWLWENVLAPLGSWTISEVLPRFLDLLSSALDIVNDVVERAKPALQWLWENFLKPIAEYAGGTFLTFLDSFHGILETIAGLLTGDFDRAVDGAREIVQSFGERFTLAKELALDMWEGIKEYFGVIAAWFYSNIIQPVQEGFSFLWANIKDAAATAWGNIKDIFRGVKSWFEDNVTGPVASGFKGFINGLLGYVESFINFFVRGINKIIDTVNALSFDVPDIMGGGSIGFNLPRVSEIQLPRLATGAVIPPNREFMAVLGDQRSGYNIEAPESLIRQIVREESGGGMNTALLQAILEAIREGKVMMVERDVFAKLVYNANKSESRRVGVSLVEV